MDAQIDPAEADDQDQAGKQHRGQIGGGFVFYMPTAEEDEYAVKDQNGEGMSAGEAVAALVDQMERQIGTRPVEGSFQEFLNQGGEDRRDGHGNAKSEPESRDQQKQEADQRYGLPIAQIGDRLEKSGQAVAAKAVDIIADHSVKGQGVPGDHKI